MPYNKCITKEALYQNKVSFAVIFNSMVVMARIARAGADGIFLLSHVTTPVMHFQRMVLGDKELRRNIGNWGSKDIEDLIERWDRLYAERPNIMRDIY